MNAQNYKNESQNTAAPNNTGSMNPKYQNLDNVYPGLEYQPKVTPVNKIMKMDGKVVPVNNFKKVDKK